MTTRHLITIICGAPGVGKTTYGRALAEKKSATFLDIDQVSERLVRAGLACAGEDPDDRDSASFKASFRTPIYETLFDLAVENSRLHEVVLVGPFTSEVRSPGWPEDLARRLKGPVEIHFLHCAPEVRHQRLALRGTPRDKAKLKDWEQHLRYYADFDRPPFPHVAIETGQPEP